jgi:hypothetical protein
MNLSPFRSPACVHVSCLRFGSLRLTTAQSVDAMCHRHVGWLLCSATSAAASSRPRPPLQDRYCAPRFDAGAPAIAPAIARTICGSSLVKCAIHGRDPHWGRFVAAAGRAGVPFDSEAVALWIGEHQLMAAGQPPALRSPRRLPLHGGAGGRRLPRGRHGADPAAAGRRSGRGPGLGLRPLGSVRADQRGLHDVGLAWRRLTWARCRCV